MVEITARHYKEFLDVGKTERECVRAAVNMAEAADYVNLQDVLDGKVPMQPKVYAVMMDKSIALFHLGTQPLEQGMQIVAAHVDSPRLDLKQHPLYEESGMAYMDTHYYGGIKKYQWVTLPLAIHGVVVRKDGTKLDIIIGEHEDDPVIGVTDLLVHLAGEQLEKAGSKVIEGEALDLLVGNQPLKGEEKDAVKANVMKLLQQKY
jgi:aspartyl aminopeptidase